VIARARPHQAGFTLLEVLATLAIFGMLLLVLGQGMQFGLQAWRGQTRAAAWPQEAETLDRTLRRLVTRSLSAEEMQQGLPIQGGPTTLVVIARLPRPQGGPPMPTEARLQLDGTHRLMLFLLPRWNVRPVTPPVIEPMVLAERVERIEFAYWQEAEGGGGAWLRAWPGPGVPALVRIHLVFPPGDPRHWPDIVAAPAMAPLALGEPTASPLAALAPQAFCDRIGACHVG
jgi:general secretion pathway protein J